MNLSKTYLSQIPVALPNKKVADSVVKLVDEILAIKKQDPSADTSALERETDQMVYKLYGLTEEEIKIVEGNSDSK